MKIFIELWIGYLQNKFLVPCWIESLWFVAGVVSGVRVGAQVEGAEWVTLPGDVLASETAGTVNFKIAFQIRLLQTNNYSINGKEKL